MDKLPSPDYPPERPGVAIRKLHPKKVKLLKHPISDRPRYPKLPFQPDFWGRI